MPNIIHLINYTYEATRLGPNNTASPQSNDTQQAVPRVGDDHIKVVQDMTEDRLGYCYYDLGFAPVGCVV